MTSMKIVQFSRPPTPLVHLRPKFFDPLDLGRPISYESPLLLQMITSQLKENIIKGWILYVIRSFLQVGFGFPYQTLILPGFPSTSFHLAEASLSAISWLYTLVCAVVNYVQLFTFLVTFLGHFFIIIKWTRGFFPQKFAIRPPPLSPNI